MLAVRRVSQNCLPLGLSRQILDGFTDKYAGCFKSSDTAILRVHLNEKREIIKIITYASEEGFGDAKELLEQMSFAESNSMRVEMWRNAMDNPETICPYLYMFAEPIESYPMYRAENTLTGVCHICLGDIQTDHFALSLTCGHVFHALCYVAWKYDTGPANVQIFLEGPEQVCIFGCSCD